MGALDGNIMSVEYKCSPIKDSSELRRIRLQHESTMNDMEFKFDSSGIRAPVYESYVKSSYSMFDDDDDNNLSNSELITPSDNIIAIINNNSDAGERSDYAVTSSPLNLKAEFSRIDAIDNDTLNNSPIIKNEIIVNDEEQHLLKEKETEECFLRPDMKNQVLSDDDIRMEFEKHRVFLENIEEAFPESVSQFHDANENINFESLFNIILDKHHELQRAGVLDDIVK